MDEIVRDAGMVGMLLELGLEDLRRFQRIRESLVVRRLSRGQIDCIEYLRLVIFGKARWPRLQRRRRATSCARYEGGR